VPRGSGERQQRRDAVREADIALYAVKSGGRDGWSFLEPLPAQAAGRPDAGSLLQSTG